MRKYMQKLLYEQHTTKVASRNTDKMITTENNNFLENVIKMQILDLHYLTFKSQEILVNMGCLDI